MNVKTNSMHLYTLSLALLIILPTCSRDKVAEWPEDQLAAYYPGIDHLRGDLYGWSYSVSTNEMGRKSNMKIPGDYLDRPRFEKPPPKAAVPDLDDQNKLKHYLEDMVKFELPFDEIISHILNYKNVLKDSLRTEFFGRFIVNGQKMSLGGWYDRFAVAGVYLPYVDAKEFLAAAQRHFVLPDINVDSVTIIVEQDSLYFYEYLDRDNGFRLRGFPVGIRSKDKHHDFFRTMAIEFTKYYDEEFVP